MNTTPDIPGYTYGSTPTRSPITLAELELMKKSVLFDVLGTNVRFTSQLGRLENAPAGAGPDVSRGD